MKTMGGENLDKNANVSITVIRRLPKYYRYLVELVDKGTNRISSQELSKMTGFTASQIRQDLNNFGGFGQQGYGYNVEELYNQLRKILGLETVYNAVIAGAGNLGQAIANFKGFEDAGYKVVALFDQKPDLIGHKVRDIEIKDSKDMVDYIKEHKIDIGIITTPKASAQQLTDEYVSAGIKGIWNFAPIDLDAPEDVIIENVRLNESLYILSYFLKTEY